MTSTDSIAALSSGHLPSGLAVIRLSGPAVRFAVETIAGKLPPARTAIYRTLRLADGTVLDKGLVLFFPAPHSFTGEDIAEFQVHGGRAVVSALLNRIAGIEGFRLAEPGEFTRRAFLNGKVDLLEAEALADLVASETEAQRRFALNNGDGKARDIYLGWRQRLIHVRAMVEAPLDFSDQEDVPVTVTDALWEEVDTVQQEIFTHIAGYRKAEMIRDGFDVVIIGAPNVGKSSLLNALSGRDAAIVTDEPGTTRDLVEVVLDVDGLKIRVTDTAGIRDGAGKVEAIGIGRALERADGADLVLSLVDIHDPVEIVGLSDMQNVLPVGTKCDLAHGKPSSEEVHVSSLTGQGLDELMKLIGQRASLALASSGDIVPWRERHVELLRSAVATLNIDRDAPAEMIAEDLRVASNQLGRIAGAVDVEDLLDVIFAQFCVGK